MQTYTIQASEAGRRLDRYVQKALPGLPVSYLHRLLRGNGFRLNGKRIRDGKTLLEEGDRLSVYLTDEQLQEFGVQRESTVSNKLPEPDVLYEDDAVVIFNKPAGLLSQRSKPDEITMTEVGAGYLSRSGVVPAKGFQFGLSNRLDRNTSGIVLMGKSVRAQQALATMLQDRSVEKYYYAIVCGIPGWEEWQTLVHMYQKDGKTNQVQVSEATGDDKTVMKSLVKRMAISRSQDLSMVKIQLITGKTHQIRAQLAAEGYPILGDPKYHPEADEWKRRYPVNRQMLCARQILFREVHPPLEALQGKRITAPLPQDMQTILSQQFTNDEAAYDDKSHITHG